MFYCDFTLVLNVVEIKISLRYSENISKHIFGMLFDICFKHLIHIIDIFKAHLKENIGILTLYMYINNQ